MRTEHTAMVLSNLRTRRSGRVLASAALGGWLCTSTPGVVAFASTDPFAGLPRVSEARLDSLRGGLRIQGYEMRFGMRVRSSVSGVGEVVTELNWDKLRGWSPTSAHVEGAHGQGRRWDAADGQWKDYATTPAAGAPNPVAAGPVIRATGSEAATQGALAPATPPAVPAVTTNNLLAGTPAPLEAAAQGLGDTPQTVAAASPPVMPFEGTAPVDVAQAVTTLPVPSLDVGTGVPAGADAGAGVASSGVAPPAPVAQSVAQNLASPTSGLSGASGQDGFELVLANTGTTQILHQITSGHVGALITNQQNGVTIDHHAEVDLTIANFTEVVGHAMNAIRARAIVGSGVNRF